MEALVRARQEEVEAKYREVGGDPTLEIDTPVASCSGCMLQDEWRYCALT